MAIVGFLRKRAVFCASALLAALSAFFVPPSGKYLSYIDWGTISVLFSLMAAVRALDARGVFRSLGGRLCALAARSRSPLLSLSLVLVFLCFFSSMLITNDVSLLTFVPLSILVLSGVLSAPLLALLVVLQTVAANMGSMLTPVGNPQNLYIFSSCPIPLEEFLSLTLPFVLLSAGLLLLCCVLFFRGSLADSADFATRSPESNENSGLLDVLPHVLVFAVAVLSVLRVVPKPVSAAFALLVLLVFDRRSLPGIDYFLLLTFMAFFVFSGNISSVPRVRSLLEDSVVGREFWVSLLSSQVVSNVPATLVLLPYSSDFRALLLGVDVGGLGTPVSSLASLISLNAFSAGVGRPLLFLSVFLSANALFLAVLCAFRIFLGGN